MRNIKSYKKFNSYKTVFAIFFILVLISSIVGFKLIQRSSGFASTVGFIDSAFAKIPSLSRAAMMFETVFLMSVFIAGPTIYAPTSSFFALAVYGALIGARFFALTGRELHTILIEMVFSALCAYLLIIYSSFVTLTGIRIFTDVKTENKRELFDGVLFRAERFRGIFNIRYVASYIMFFILFLALSCCLAVFKVFLLSL